MEAKNRGGALQVKRSNRQVQILSVLCGVATTKNSLPLRRGKRVANRKRSLITAGVMQGRPLEELRRAWESKLGRELTRGRGAAAQSGSPVSQSGQSSGRESVSAPKMTFVFVS